MADSCVPAKRRRSGETIELPEDTPERDDDQQEMEASVSVIDDADLAKEAFDVIRKEKLVAADCEGVELSRSGVLSLVVVATRERTFLFDIKQLDQSAFEGLKEILEDEVIVKLFFDCKQDSDALWHLFDVKLNNVMDVQLLQVLYERKFPGEKSEHQLTLERRLESRYPSSWNKITRIRGMGTCIEWYLKDAEAFETKQRIDHNLWLERPLRKEMIGYAVNDVKCLFKLHDKFEAGLDDTQIRIAREGSRKYADLLRRKERRSPRFERHNLLPLYILEDFPESVATKRCIGCDRSLPVKDIDGSGLCLVCRNTRPK